MELGIHVGTFSRSSFSEVLDAVEAVNLDCIHLNLAAAGMPSMPDRLDTGPGPPPEGHRRLQGLDARPLVSRTRSSPDFSACCEANVRTKATPATF